MKRFLSAIVVALVAGCQSWVTIEFSVPAGSEAQIRQRVQEISSSVALLPCAEWGVGVTNSDECFGGRVGGNRVTVFTESREQAYVVKLHVFAAGLYDKSELEILERRYSAALEQLFPQGGIVRKQTHELPRFSRVAAPSAGPSPNPSVKGTSCAYAQAAPYVER